MVRKPRWTPVTSHSQRNVAVYVTRRGTRYHKAGCRYLRWSKSLAIVKDVQERRAVCRICDPPT